MPPPAHPSFLTETVSSCSSRTPKTPTSIPIAGHAPADGPANYFGFWWSAGDSLNRISIYQGHVLIAQSQTSDITSLLFYSPLTAVDGVTTYLTSAYYGNPNSGAFSGKDAGEPFAYVNIVATGFTFDKLVLDNAGSSGFETDNHSVYTGTIDIPKDFSSFVKVKDVSLVNEPVPEPGYAGLLSVLLLALAFWNAPKHGNSSHRRQRPD